MIQILLLVALLALIGCGRTVTKPTPPAPPPPVSPPAPPPAPPPPPTGLESIKVSANGRFFETTSGKAFFMLGDTNWALANLQTREEVQDYMSNRKAKGFNLVLTTAFINLVAPNRYDPTSPPPTLAPTRGWCWIRPARGMGHRDSK